MSLARSISAIAATSKTCQSVGFCTSSLFVRIPHPFTALKKPSKILACHSGAFHSASVSAEQLKSTSTLSHTQQVLQLYRQCLKSANQIQDVEWKETYRIRVRKGFRDNASLSDAKSKVKMEETKDEVDRMNYYHTLRQKRDSQGELAALELMDDTNTSTTSSRNQQQSNNHNNATKHQETEKKDENDKVGSNTTSMDTKHQIVQEWLQSLMPNLHLEDVHYYTDCLIEDGFDSIEMLNHELTFTDNGKEDLYFMKKAHARVLIRNLQNRIQHQQLEKQEQE